MRAGTLVPATRSAPVMGEQQLKALNEGRNFSSGNTSGGGTPVNPGDDRSMRAGTLVPATPYRNDEDIIRFSAQ